jgi:hypothetical protein
LKPNSFTDATWSQRSSGGLSIDVDALGSNAPSRKLCSDSPIDRTAAS